MTLEIHLHSSLAKIELQRQLYAGKINLRFRRLVEVVGEDVQRDVGDDFRMNVDRV